MSYREPMPGATEFSVSTERKDDQTSLVRLNGDVDLHTAPEVRQTLNDAIDDGAMLIVVDLSAVTFIDSMTLGVLLGASKRVRPRGGQLRLVVTEPSIRKIFEITLLDKIFQLYDDTDSALS